jgi:hypothetical protein
VSDLPPWDRRIITIVNELRNSWIPIRLEKLRVWWYGPRRYRAGTHNMLPSQNKEENYGTRRRKAKVRPQRTAHKDHSGIAMGLAIMNYGREENGRHDLKFAQP